MTDNTFPFQPGAILHDVLVGAFRASGSTFEQWCKDNGVRPMNARHATFGQSRGKVGSETLRRLIDAAGRDFVREAYRRRIVEHYRDVVGGA